MEIIKREYKIKRWEREIQRLENEESKVSEKSMKMQGEFERMCSMRLDDAMLIERLRGS